MIAVIRLLGRGDGEQATEGIGSGWVSPLVLSDDLVLSEGRKEFEEQIGAAGVAEFDGSEAGRSDTFAAREFDFDESLAHASDGVGEFRPPFEGLRAAEACCIPDGSELNMGATAPFNFSGVKEEPREIDIVEQTRVERSSEEIQ